MLFKGHVLFSLLSLGPLSLHGGNFAFNVTQVALSSSNFKIIGGDCGFLDFSTVRSWWVLGNIGSWETWIYFYQVVCEPFKSNFLG